MRGDEGGMTGRILCIWFVCVSTCVFMGVSDGEGRGGGEEGGLGGSPAVWPYAPAFSCLFSLADQRAHLH